MRRTRTKESEQTVTNNNNRYVSLATLCFNPHNNSSSNHSSALHMTPDGTKKHINHPHNHTPLNDCSADVQQRRVRRERTESVIAIPAGTSCEARVGEMSVTFAITRKTWIHGMSTIPGQIMDQSQTRKGLCIPYLNGKKMHKQTNL